MTKIRLSGYANRSTCAHLIREAREARHVSRMTGMETIGLAYCMAENLATEARAQGEWSHARMYNAAKKALEPLYLN